MKSLVAVLLFVLPLSTLSQLDIKIVQKDSTVVILNKHEVFITNLTTELVDFEILKTEIEESGEPDAPLMIRILESIKNDEGKLKELLAMRKTYKTIQSIFDQHVYDQLVLKYGREELNKLLDKK